MRILALAPLLIALIFGGFFYWGLDPERDPNALPSELISKPAPQFDLPPVAGLATPGLSQADLINNDSLRIVNVFASWCVPCRAEHRVLTELVENEGQVLLGINYKDKPHDAVRWLEELGNPYQRVGSDIDGRAGIEWGIAGVPETFIVGADGVVLYRYVGPIVGEDAVARFRQALANAQSDGSDKEVGG